MANPQNTERPKSLHETGEDVLKWENCPHCKGRGWFLINPFAIGGSNGAGGLQNVRQCQTCVAAKRHWDEHGVEPEDVENLEGAEG
jgi:hypothetical protein